MKKIKVVFVLPHLRGGGAERMFVNFIRQLDFDKFKITLLLVNNIGPLLELVPKKVNIINLDSERTIYSFFKMRQAILRARSDIVLATHHRTNVSVFFALKGIRNRPYLIFRCPNSPLSIKKNNQLPLLTKKLLDIAYNGADMVIAQTPEMKIELNEIHFVDLKKILVLINPLDKSLILDKIKRSENPMGPNTINVVASGRLSFEKGFDILINSFKIVIDQNPNFRLYILGNDGGMKSELEFLITSNKLEKYVFLLGFQSNPYKYYFYCNLYVLSSRWEGLPNTVLENLFLNKPVIATKCIPYLDKLIDNGRNGLLVEVEDVKGIAYAILDYKTIKDFNNIQNQIPNANIQEMLCKVYEQKPH